MQWKSCCLVLLLILQLVISTTPVSERRGWGMESMAHRKHNVKSDMAEKELIQNMQKCLTSVFYGGGAVPSAGAKAPHQNPARQRTAVEAHTSGVVTHESVDDSTSLELETSSATPKSPSACDSFASNSAFVASVQAQHGGSGFWIPSQGAAKCNTASPQLPKQEEAKAAVATSPVLKDEKQEVAREETKTKSGVLGGLRRATSYEKIHEDGILQGETHKLPHTQPEQVPAARETSTEEVVDKKAGGEVAEHGATSDDDAKARRRRAKPWLPFLTRKKEDEEALAALELVKAKELEQEAAKGAQQKPAMWLPPRPEPAGEAKTVKDDAADTPKAKTRGAPWIPSVAPTGEKKEDKAAEEGGQKPRRAMWIPGMGQTKPVPPGPAQVEPPSPVGKAGRTM
eukprot:CAMPEP_0177722242 /NCGR_PEP_ID=MMETSP0484_2-20121128/17580_1 /TAXON_ID=354590 /ORGANISM="Rhodomonas lens, Strain RHODO" /LENGTH=398 /DNA_ID=CAMNT_0019234609 /DNA_START=249 /DNA_END=1442 /DNA_ORIENTATION=-